jgi:hypothetical protein
MYGSSGATACAVKGVVGWKPRILNGLVLTLQ